MLRSWYARSKFRATDGFGFDVVGRTVRFGGRLLGLLCFLPPFLPCDLDGAERGGGAEAAATEASAAFLAHFVPVLPALGHAAAGEGERVVVLVVSAALFELFEGAADGGFGHAFVEQSGGDFAAAAGTPQHAPGQLVGEVGCGAFADALEQRGVDLLPRVQPQAASEGARAAELRRVVEADGPSSSAAFDFDDSDHGDTCLSCISGAGLHCSAFRTDIRIQELS